MNDQPFEMVSGPLKLYRAEADTSFPILGADPPSAWVLVGLSGDENYDEDGVTVNPEHSLESQRVLGTTGPRKKYRTEEDLMLTATILDMTLESFAFAMNAATITEATGTTEGVTEIRVTNGGTGYTSAPAVSFTGGGGGSGAAATAKIGPGGIVTNVEITNRGSGYSSAPTVVFTGGGGSNAAATAVTGDIPDYKRMPLKRGFDVDTFAFLARGYSPYSADGEAQFWIPRAVVESVGEISYVKGESAGFELEVSALDHSTWGFGEYQAEE